MTPERYGYRKAEANGRKPSIDLRLPIVVRYLQVPLNQLILKLDVAEEREQRIEEKLDQLLELLTAEEPKP